MKTHKIYSYNATDHLDDPRPVTRYTARPTTENSVRYDEDGDVMGVTVSRTDPELAYELTGPVDICQSVCGTECVYPYDDESGVPLEDVIEDPGMRSFLGVQLREIDPAVENDADDKPESPGMSP